MIFNNTDFSESVAPLPPRMSDAEFERFLEHAHDLVALEDARQEQAQFEADMNETLRALVAGMASDELLALETKSPETQRAYEQDCRRFKEFCDEIMMPFLPASPEVVCGFLIERAEDGATATTINRLSAAIGYGHRVTDNPDPTEHPLVRATVRHLVKTAKQTNGVSVIEVA